jgi:hypothetical protein
LRSDGLWWQDSFAIFASRYSTVWTKLDISADRQFVNFTDVFALPSQHACQATGQYELRWRDKQCLLPTLYVIHDPCTQRVQLWNVTSASPTDGLTMIKRACRGPADGICSIQERTVWVTQKKHDARSWLVFGGNNAYVEVWEQRSGNHTAFFGRVAENNKKVRGRVGDSSSKSDLTFDRSMLALTELASYPAAQQCALSVSTGVYRVRGLDETSASLAAGTFEPLHGVTGHMRWRHDNEHSDSDASSSSSSSSSSLSATSSWSDRKRDRMHEQYGVSSSCKCVGAFACLNARCRSSSYVSSQARQKQLRRVSL